VIETNNNGVRQKPAFGKAVSTPKKITKPVASTPRRGAAERKVSSGGGNVIN